MSLALATRLSSRRSRRLDVVAGTARSAVSAEPWSKPSRQAWRCTRGSAPAPGVLASSWERRSLCGRRSLYRCALSILVITEIGGADVSGRTCCKPPPPNRSAVHADSTLLTGSRPQPPTSGCVSMRAEAPLTGDLTAANRGSATPLTRFESGSKMSLHPYSQIVPSEDPAHRSGPSFVNLGGID